MKTRIMLLTALLCLSPLAVTHAAQSSAADHNAIMKKYNATRQKTAEAQTNNMYSAYGRNMGNLIKQRVREGLVIDGPGEYADGQVVADGVGNVVVQDGARVNGPIINQMQLEETTVIMQKSNTGRMPRGKKQ